MAKHANGWQQFVWWGFWLNNNPKLALECTRQMLATKNKPLFQANNQLYDIPSIGNINQGYVWVIFSISSVTMWKNLIPKYFSLVTWRHTLFQPLVLICKITLYWWLFLDHKIVIRVLIQQKRCAKQKVNFCSFCETDCDRYKMDDQWRCRWILTWNEAWKELKKKKKGIFGTTIKR